MYQNLYDSLKQTNIKKYYDIGKDLKQRDFEGALGKLYNTTDQNIIEQNLKTVYSIFAETNLDRNQMDSTQKATMEGVANQKAVLGGDAVYYARAYLNKLIIDEFNEDGLRKRNPELPKPITAKSNDIGKFPDIRIVPNPATNTFSINLPDPLLEKITFLILDLYGRVLSLKTMPKGTFSYPVNIENLASGSYFIRFYSSDILISQKKLVISK